jgi:hypothetical protein
MPDKFSELLATQQGPPPPPQYRTQNVTIVTMSNGEYSRGHYEAPVDGNDLRFLLCGIAPARSRLFHTRGAWHKAANYYGHCSYLQLDMRRATNLIRVNEQLLANALHLYFKQHMSID